MANGNIVEFFIKINGNTTAVMNKLSGAFHQATVNAQKAQSVVGQLPLTINQVSAKLDLLNQKKGFVRTYDDLRKVNSEIKKTTKELSHLENLPPKGFISRMNQMAESITGFSLKDIGIAMFAGEALSFLKESTKMYDEGAKNQAQMVASITSTGGAANRTMQQLNDQASEMMGKTIFDDDVINKAQSVLLTFTNIKDTIFDQAIPAIADLATKMGTDLNSATLQVGKALNDPVKGVTALRREGVQLTEEQEANIKKLVDAGKIHEAQLIILKELQTEFGGSAEAAAKVGLGPIQQLANIWDDFRKKVGGMVLEIVNKVIPTLKGMASWMAENAGILKTVAKAVVIAAAAFVAFRAVMLANNLVQSLMVGGMLRAKIALIAETYATQGLSKAMLVLNGVSKASVFGALVGVALAAVTAFSLFEKKTDETADAVERAKAVGQDYYSKEKMNLDLIFEKLKRTNPQSKERNRLVDELKQMYPGLNTQIENEIRNTNNLSNAYGVLIGQIKAKAMAKAKESALESIYANLGDTYAKIDEITSKLYQSQSKPEWKPTGPDDETYKYSGFFRDSKKPLTESEIRDAVERYIANEGRIQVQDKQGNWLSYENKDAAVSLQKANIILKSIANQQFGAKATEHTGGESSTSTTSKVTDAITGGGKNIKQIYINIDSLIKSNTNQFTPGMSPKDATSFLEQLTNALQLVVNDVNYTN